MRVRDFAPEDAVRWEAFVERSPEATFFHRVGWRAILEGCFGHRTRYLLAEQDAKIVGVLPLAEVKSLLFGHALVSLPFCAVAGVAASDPQAAAALHRRAQELGERIGAQHLELRNAAPREPGWPRQDLYAAFRKTLLADVDANLLAIPRKQRAMVRKGIKHGLAAELDPGVERFFSLYADNVHRHGTPPLPKRYFEALRTCERGVRVFDFGRSKQGTGPYDFKKNWGFEPAPLAYEYCLYRRSSIPQNNPLNPKYRALIALWRRLPIRVANFLGPHLVKSLG
jgi:hypothetical protein